jgi:Icc-related predicted phosphoesterase
VKLFCLSDTHGGPPPASLGYVSGQVILHAGDLYNEGNPSLHSAWSKVVHPAGGDNDLLVVRGNHDCVNTPLLQAHDVTLGLRRAGDIWIVGVGWCGQEYNQLPPEALMTKGIVRLMDAIAKTFQDGDRCVLLTHYPPTHSMFKNQEGWEFKCINALVEAIRPLAVIAGHRHGLAGRTFYQGVVPIIFPGPKGGWLEVGEEVKWN